MGVHVTEEESDAAVCYYDLDGTGEMSYEVRIVCMLLSWLSLLALKLLSLTPINTHA